MSTAVVSMYNLTFHVYVLRVFMAGEIYKWVKIRFSGDGDRDTEGWFM